MSHGKFDDNFITKYVPKEKQKHLTSLVTGLQSIDEHAGLGHEAAIGVANAAIGAYNLNTRLEQYNKAVNLKRLV